MRKALKLLAVLFVFPFLGIAQMTMAYDNDLVSYNRGVALLEKQMFGAAKEQFETAIQIADDPNSEISANAHFYVAKCATELFHKDAEYRLKQFIERYPSSTRVEDAWFLLGSYNYRKRDWEDAIQFFDELNPKYLAEPRKSEYLFKKGYAHFQEKQLKEAADLFFQLNNQTSIYYAPGVYYLGHVNYEQEKYAMALKQFQSLEDHPQFGDVVPYYIVQIYHFQEEFDNLIGYGSPLLDNNEIKRRDEIARLIGESLYSEESYAEAVPFLEKYMLSPYQKQPQDYYAMGYAYYQSNQFAKAAETFSKISYTDDSLGQNALYHLGEAYLKSQKKSYARNAYKAAAKLAHNPKITEDALYKYALLSYELSYDPYEGAIAAFKDYINRYPNTERTQKSFDYLVNIYLTSKNYDAALSSIEAYENPDIRLKEAFQRIAFNKAVTLFQDRLLAKSIEYFDKSLIYDQNKILTAEAHYWIAEAHYYREEFSLAVKSYEAFIYSPGAVLTPYFNLANYNIGYAYFRQDQFSNAPSWLRRFTSYNQEEDEVKLADANLRIGDCYFMLNDYTAAKDYYDAALELGKSTPDYALFQSGLTEGLLKNYQGKIDKMEKLAADFPASNYVGAAYYELGKTYLNPSVENQDKSVELMNKVVDEFPGSSYVRKAMVSMGQTYYNQSKDDEALAVFLDVVKKFPTYEDTREALQGIENIYSERGQIATYEELIGSLDFVNISELALDSINYNAAEKQYFNAQCAEAVQNFDRYLGRFEKAVFELNARYYRAECNFNMGNVESAQKDFEFVADQPKNKFSEQSLVQSARINYAQNDYPRALAYYQRLDLLGERSENLLEASIGMMRTNYELNNFQGAFANALAVLDAENIDAKLKQEANLLAAKSNLQLGSPAEARIYLNEVVEHGSMSKAAEASYLVARIAFNADQLDSAEALVFGIVENYQSQAFWLGKSLLLLTDIYISRGDLFQAKATVNSIIDNYEKDDEVKTEAQKKLEQIQEIESQPEVEEKPEIEIDFEMLEETIESIETPQDSLKNE